MNCYWKGSLAALGGVVLAGVAGTGPVSAQDTITAASWGGAYSMSQREAYYKPALKDIGMTVLEDEWGGAVSEIRIQVETGDYKWEVLDADVGTSLAACDEGLLEELDWDMLGGKDRFFPGSAFDCAVGTISYGTIYAYNGDTYPDPATAPQTVADFFDFEKFPGKRAIYTGVSHTIEMALMAAKGMTAVEAQAYYQENTDEAFAEATAFLEPNKDQLVYWETGAMAPQLLADGEVVMTTAWNGRIYNANVQEGKNFVIVWDGQKVDYDVWAIPAGHPNAEAGMKFIEYASRPEVMARQSQHIAYGPTTEEAAALIAPDVLKDLPTASANLTNAYWADAEWIADHIEDLEERWAVWKAS
ncbi:MAG: extracellular solute-binding protein [Proteobacteria bacterium]|nr:extracellular solute-binding protein [Pseudomonadota bacterium]